MTDPNAQQKVDAIFKAHMDAELAGNPVSPANDLVELHGTTIRVVGGECPSAR